MRARQQQLANGLLGVWSRNGCHCATNLVRSRRMPGTAAGAPRVSNQPQTILKNSEKASDNPPLLPPPPLRPPRPPIR